MATIDSDIQVFTESIGASLLDTSTEERRILKQVFRRANYFTHPAGFMIVKISRSEKPFWGVGVDQIEFLSELLDNYFLVLLESPRSGYVFNKSQIDQSIKRGAWSKSGNQHKINSPLPIRHVFRNPEQFLEKVQAG